MFRAKFSFFVLIGALCLAGAQAFAASNHISITQKRMKYGPTGTSTPVSKQCWTKIDTREYAKCLFPNGVNNGIVKVELKSQTMQVAPTLSDK